MISTQILKTASFRYGMKYKEIHPTLHTNVSNTEPPNLSSHKWMSHLVDVVMLRVHPKPSYTNNANKQQQTTHYIEMRYACHMVILDCTQFVAINCWARTLHCLNTPSILWCALCSHPTWNHLLVKHALLPVTDFSISSESLIVSVSTWNEQCCAWEQWEAPL